VSFLSFLVYSRIKLIVTFDFHSLTYAKLIYLYKKRLESLHLLVYE
jgi:hypothetical protein